MKLKFSGLGSIFGGPIGTFLGHQTDKAIDTAQRQAKNATILAQQEAAAQIQAVEDAKDEIENAKQTATAQRRDALRGMSRTRFASAPKTLLGSVGNGSGTTLLGG